MCPPLAPISQFDLHECRSEEEEDREENSGLISNVSGALPSRVKVNSIRGLKTVKIPLRTPSKSAASTTTNKALHSKMVQF